MFPKPPSSIKSVLNGHNEKKVQCQLWISINQSQLEILINSFKKDASFSIFLSLISNNLSLDPNKILDRILIEKYFYLLQYGLEENFSCLQINVIFSLFYRLHEAACSTAFENLDKTYDYVKRLIIAYTVHRPPYYIQLFTPAQANRTLEYLTATYFKCFSAIKYTFIYKIRLKMCLMHFGIIKSQSSNEMKMDIANPNIIFETLMYEAKNDMNEKGIDETTQLRDIIRFHLKYKLEKINSRYVIKETDHKNLPKSLIKNRFN